jgi:hypothetical protein
MDAYFANTLRVATSGRRRRPSLTLRIHVCDADRPNRGCAAEVIYHGGLVLSFRYVEQSDLQDFPHATLIGTRATLTGIYGECCTVCVLEWSHFIAKRL